MSSPLRTLRPALSPRWQILRRAASTEAAPPQKSFISRNRSRIVWSTAALGVGLIAGNLVSQTIAPDALPDAGTSQDRMLITDLNQRLDKSSKVRALRSRCVGTANEGDCVEIVKNNALSRDGMIESLAGYKALGVGRVFWDKKEKTLTAIIWFGASVSGWPGVTHGGMIATQFLEKIGLASTLMHSKDLTTEQSSNHANMMMPSRIQEPEELSLSYVKPTFAEDFYIIRVRTALPLNRDPQHVIPAEPLSGHHDYESTLETLEGGKILVKAKARIPLSSITRMEQKSVDAGERMYDQVKQWLWSSRHSS